MDDMGNPTWYRNAANSRGNVGLRGFLRAGRESGHPVLNVWFTVWIGHLFCLG